MHEENSIVVVYAFGNIEKGAKKAVKQAEKAWKEQRTDDAIVLLTIAQLLFDLSHTSLLSATLWSSLSE